MGASFSSIITQMFPPKPDFTENDLPNLHGKVYIVTGSTAGVGKELARILYLKNAKVYMAARTESKANKAIEEISKAAPTSKGSLIFLPLDLADLSTIKASVERFLATESKLHVLFNNAGVQSLDPLDVKTAQGYEINMGVNCVGTFLFTKLLTPLLIATAKLEPANTVRVVWVSSSGTEFTAVKNIGVDIDNLDYKKKEEPALVRYGLSKAGNWCQGVEFAKRYAADGVISIPLNPGNLDSELYREQGKIFKLVTKLILYPSLQGAYTELFAGLSPKITLEKTGSWVIPFGRILPIRGDLVNATKTEAEGGTGGTYKFWEWNEEQVKPYF